MQRLFKNIICTALAFAMAISIVVLSACGDETATTDNYTVTFDLNYQGAAAPTTKTVAPRTAVEEPAAPTREDYKFDYWCEDAAGTTQVDFENAITSNRTYYAKWTKTVATVTLNPNYDGAATTTMKANIGDTLTQPVDPKRENYIFDEWYTESDCKTVYDFDTSVTDDFTLFAGWTEVSSDSDNFTVTFNYNYENAPQNGVYYTRTVVAGRMVGLPSNPQREGYYFNGWFTDESCTQSIAFPYTPVKSVNIYAFWLKTHVFEAEFTDVSNIEGHGYSGEVSGTNIIEADVDNTGASNGRYLSYLYGNGIEVVFEIEAEEAYENAVLALSLAGEMVSFTLTDEIYLVQVNGNNLKYEDISFDLTGVSSTPFETYVISTTVSLQKGKNIIKLITNNSLGMAGTMYATAPRVDCLYLYANVGLDWASGFPLTSNVAG